MEETKNKVKPQWFLLWGGTLLVAICIRLFLQPTVVLGLSMYPTYHNSQYLFTNPYYKELDKNQVVTIKLPDNVAEDIGINKSLIKRIVAVPGDTVLIHNGYLYINGIKQSSDFPKIKDGGLIQDNEITLQEDEYFVLGDNRNNSIDSRVIGPVKKDWISATVCGN